MPVNGADRRYQTVLAAPRRIQRHKVEKYRVRYLFPSSALAELPEKPADDPLVIKEYQFCNASTNEMSALLRYRG